MPGEAGGRGTFYIELGDLDAWNKFEVMCLVLHETLPGQFDIFFPFILSYNIELKFLPSCNCVQETN